MWSWIWRGVSQDIISYWLIFATINRQRIFKRQKSDISKHILRFCAFGLKHIYVWDGCTLLETHHIYARNLFSFAKQFQENNINFKPERAKLCAWNHHAQTVKLKKLSIVAKPNSQKGHQNGGRLQTPSRGRCINQLWPERERARTRTSVSLREALCLPTIKDSPTWCMCMSELGIYSFDLANTLQNAFSRAGIVCDNHYL